MEEEMALEQQLLDKPVYPGVIPGYDPAMLVKYKGQRPRTMTMKTVKSASLSSSSEAAEFKAELKKAESAMSEEEVRDKYYAYWERQKMVSGQKEEEAAARISTYSYTYEPTFCIVRMNDSVNFIMAELQHRALKDICLKSSEPG